jgi:hypothetical protein
MGEYSDRTLGAASSEALSLGAHGIGKIYARVTQIVGPPEPGRGG